MNKYQFIEGSFKKRHTIFARMSESKRIQMKYPDRIPVIIEHSNSNHTLPPIDKQKYLVPKDLTIGQFSYVIRKRINLPSNQAMFLMINNKMMNTAEKMENIYENNKENDNFMYVTISSESTFG